MKNGIEKRKNGAVIRRTPSGCCYAVTRPDGTPSKNGPWDYLANARRDADGVTFGPTLQGRAKYPPRNDLS